jgi:hypothetical protein
MEQAVELSPRDAGYRMGLGDLYMRSGRFASAETSYSDVVAIDPSNDRAAFNIAVAQLAQGNTGAAIERLRTLEGRLPSSDLGLAYALSGDTQHALELLEPAARAPDASGRVRQNLALAYALAGDWKKARVTASQDVAPSQLNARLAQWAAIADPSASGLRVANVLGVKPVTDRGQPTRLALAPLTPSDTALAQADVSSALQPTGDVAANAQEAVQADQPVQEAESQPAIEPAQQAAAETSVAEPAVASIEPVDPTFVEAARTLVEAPKPDSATSEGRMASIRALVATRYDQHQLKPHTRAVGPGRYVVQLGAFNSPAHVERAWSVVQHRYPSISDRQPMSTTVRLGDRLYHRLSVAGFADSKSAVQVCHSIRAKGGACFVRTVAGDSPVQWASRTARKA